ncbi:heavy-metal-associated domain-containing protein [Olleya sp. R77988]|uniref:heavy-metal-associated domain-containing protein n=1 Tax=Olleya sp. R77988 TaxID=3093875 RepID=UPI0037C5B703
MKKLVLVLLMMATSITFAQEKNKRASLEVDGVCGMCKSRIEKACFKTKGVKSAVWSIETHELKLIFDENKTDLKTIESNIAAVGHDTKEIKASDEAYDGIHGCCKYRDEDVIDDHKKEE